MTTQPPEIIVLGGPNGSGKSTVAGVVLPDAFGAARFVNADYIAKALSPHAPERSAFEAGRIMLRQLDELRDQGESFAFESTLASRTFAPFLSEAKARGYVVRVTFVFLSSADLAVRRVRLRVERGGHDIPEPTVRRRYSRSLRNFFQLYRPLADGWDVWDNSGESLVPVARGRGNREISIFDTERWKQVQQEGAADGI